MANLTLTELSRLNIQDIQVFGNRLLIGMVLVCGSLFLLFVYVPKWIKAVQEKRERKENELRREQELKEKMQERIDILYVDTSNMTSSQLREYLRKLPESFQIPKKYHVKLENRKELAKDRIENLEVKEDTNRIKTEGEMLRVS